MKLIIGLGNPGRVYAETRHNVGYKAIDAFLESKTCNLKSWKGVKVFKTDTFMNESGFFVKKLAARYKIPASDLYIIHDDLDIKLGEYKIQLGRGPKDHKGILSIEKELGDKNFWRVRIGVDNRLKVNSERQEGEDYVLENFTDDERQILDKVIKGLCRRIVSKLQ